MTRHRCCSKPTLKLLQRLAAKPRQWCLGYELSTETGLKPGTLYPILLRLSDRGWLESRWQETAERGRPPRHQYRLTAAGLQYARSEFTAADADLALPAASRQKA